jgi:3-deoxy-7-phosphoheptulonate synthase
VRINQAGVPAGCEFLDVISPQYIGDLVSWGAIGARTTESQVHRELASGLSAPVGFKNGTDGNVKIAVDALLAARQKHHFLSVHKSGQVAIVETRGNDDCHIILRGGKSPNYDAASVAAACQELAKAKLHQRLMIDCSHANASKQYQRQMDVARDIGAQLADGRAAHRRRDGRVAPRRRAARSSSRASRSNSARASPTPASAGAIRPRCSPDSRTRSRKRRK